MPTPNPIRFAYVGCGFVAQTIHIPNFKSLPDCSFLAIAEAREELGKSVAARFNIPKCYRSHEEIAADPDIEAVGVSAAYALQGRIAEDLVRAGKHVFMEKPMAVSIARAESIVTAVSESNARLMVGYMKRYDPGNLAIKRYIDLWRSSGEVGELVYARNHGFGGNWTYGRDPNVIYEQSDASMPPAPDECPLWLPQDWQGRYLSYLQQWTHNINLLRFFLGDTDGNIKIASVQLDDDGITGIVVLEINGTRCVVESAYTDFHGWDEQTHIYFQKAWLKTQAPALMAKEIPATVEVYRASEDAARPPSLTQEFVTPAWAYREEAKHFLERVRSGEPFRSSAEDTLYDVRLIEEIYRANLKQCGEI